MNWLNPGQNKVATEMSIQSDSVDNRNPVLQGTQSSINRVYGVWNSIPEKGIPKLKSQIGVHQVGSGKHS